MTNIQLASEDWVNSGKTWENVVNTVKSIKYGRLYNWYAATDPRGIAPIGWHVPSDDEWQTLIDYAGGNTVAGGKLREIGTTHWDSPNTTATDDYNFKALGAGQTYDGITGYLLTETSKWWISDINGKYRQVDPTWAGINQSTGLAKNYGISIRLIKDNSTNEGDVIIDGDTYHAVTIGTQVWLQQNLAVRHYQNGDLILSDFSGTVGAVCAYNNDESNVYDIVTVTDPTHIGPILSKMIYVNAVDFRPLVEYADNATAISAGLTVGQLYTTTGSLKIVYLIPA